MRSPKASKQMSGFSLAELLVAMVLIVVVVGIAFYFFIDFTRQQVTESSFSEAQDSARSAVDEMGRNIQQAGYGISRTPTNNPAAWQKAIVFAGSHAFAFNADIDATRGQLSSATSVTFPDGSTYPGQSASNNTTGAETYVYTIDANDDGALTALDRTAAVSGGYNPAAETANPLDYALFKKVYGWDGSAVGGTPTPISGHLFTNALSTDKYPDNSRPNSLFTYWLSEDIDSDGILQISECVVGTCPPSSPVRAPKLYLWGDTDFDGVLSDTEKEALRTTPVGSPNWSKNKLVTGSPAAYISTTLADPLVPSSSSYQIKVTSPTGFGVGQYIQVGTEKLVIDSIDAANKLINLDSPTKISHASGDAVTILPDTLLAAIRAVQVNYDAIGPTIVAPGTTGATPVGVAGRAGTRGLQYPVRTYERRIEVTNMRTEPLNTGLPASLATTCPLNIATFCSFGGTQNSIRLFTSSGASTLSWHVTDSNGIGVDGVTVTFSSPTKGTAGATSAKTKDGGVASVTYTPGATAATDTITATTTCVSAGTSYTYASTRTIVLVAGTFTATLSKDCLSTISARTAAPTSVLTLAFKDGGTGVAGATINVAIQFDPAYLPATPDYSKIEATLMVGGTNVGVTDSGAGRLDYALTTDASGNATATIILTKDTEGASGTANGAQIDITSTVNSCTYGPIAKSVSLNYYKMNLTTTPANCTSTTSPLCTNDGTAPPPTVNTILTLNGVGVASQAVTFVKTDSSTTGAASSLSPGSPWITDSNGSVTTTINADSSSGAIDLSTPLTVTVDAQATPAGCSAGLVPMDPIAGFQFTGTVSGCDIAIDGLAKSGKSKNVTVVVQNIGAVGTCPVTITGIQVNARDASFAPITTQTYSYIGGGAVDTTGSTSTANKTGSVELFKSADCGAGGTNLANNTAFTFLTTNTLCKPFGSTSTKSPFVPKDVPGGSFGTIDTISATTGFTLGNTVVVTIFYKCNCAGGGTNSKTKTLTVS